MMGYIMEMDLCHVCGVCHHDRNANAEMIGATKTK